MPSLRVEYSPSARATCGLKQCGKRIEKNEVRVGTLVILPYGDGVESWKWRHLCCFTQRQLDNARAAGDLDAPDHSGILGYDTLAKSDKTLVDAMLRGELIDKTELIGRTGDIANAPLTQPHGGPKRGSKTTRQTKESGDSTVQTRSTGKRPVRRPAEAQANTANDADSEATEEYEVAVTTERPECPYGDKCFRTDPEHFAEYTHGDADTAQKAGASGRKRPVIVRRKDAR